MEIFNMKISQEIKQVIQGLNKGGNNVIYFPELNDFWIFTSFTPNGQHGINTSNGMHELTGQDISHLIQHYDVNLKNFSSYANKVVDLPKQKIKLHKDIKFICFLA